MKIIIEHKNRKRTIVGSFRICGNAEDLLRVARQVLLALDHPEEEYCHASADGWIDIHAPLPPITNTPTVQWLT